MHLVKLNAVDSTNDYLKELANKQYLENFTVVTAENQTDGKGQMGAKWNSEKGKNLIVSVLIKDAIVNAGQIYDLNAAAAVAIISSLETYDLPNLSIKWPNDIMSGEKKIGGILIENSFKSDGNISSVVGFGLNVNQTNFENLPRASSMALVSNQTFDRDLLLLKILAALKLQVGMISERAAHIRNSYAEKLFKMGVPMPFESQSGKRFMGIIQGITGDGRLEILREDDSLSIFGIKEVQLLY